MSHYRSGHDSEQSNHFLSSAKKHAPAGVHSPRKGLINGPISSQLHCTPVAVAVSATGERTICPVETVSNPKNITSTNPFANEHKESAACLESSSEETIQKFPSKRQGGYIQKRRKIQEKERRRTAKIILTQRNSARPRQAVIQRTTSVQTDPQVTGIYRPLEFIGDPGRPSLQSYEYDVSLTPRRPKRSVRSINDLNIANKEAAIIDNFFAKFMPSYFGLKPSGPNSYSLFDSELLHKLVFSDSKQSCPTPLLTFICARGDISNHESLKILTSFMVMIILIFWLTSIILDVEVPSDFFRMATNYLYSFQWGHDRKQPQTNAERMFEYLRNFFK